MVIEQLINTYNQHEILGQTLEDDIKAKMIQTIKSRLKLHSVAIMDASIRYMHPLSIEVDYSQYGDFKTSLGYRPKTKILYSNYIELELLRILHKLDPTVSRGLYVMVKKRIQTTCFGRFCDTGECFEISLQALRFIAQVFPGEVEWINQYIREIGKVILAGDKKVAYQTKLLYAWTLYQINSQVANETLHAMIDCLCAMEGKFAPPKSDYDQLNGVILYYVLRACTPMQVRLS